MRLIDADEAKKALTGWDSDPTDEEIEYTIDELPTIEAAPVVHGRWKKTYNGPRQDINTGELIETYKYDCPFCGYHTGNQGRNFNYCPNCGARMDGDEKATTMPTAGSNYQSCKHCNSTFIGLEEYAECPVCGQPF